MDPIPRLSDEEYLRWCEEGFVELRQILYWRWDPIGVTGAFPTTAGEYDRYARELLRGLREGMQRDEIAAYLRQAEGGITLGTTDAFRLLVAERIEDWYETSLEWWTTGQPYNEAHRRFTDELDTRWPPD